MVLDKLKAVAKTTSSVYAQSRKAVVALAPPGFLVAGNYIGGQPVPHVWYHFSLGIAGALGVYTVTNAPSSSELSASGPPDGKEPQ